MIQNWLMGSNSPRRYKAQYASSMGGEIHKNVRLEPGEQIVETCLVRERKNWLIAAPRLLAITPQRVILVEHHLFSADWIVEIPRSAVTQVSCEETSMNAWVVFTYSGDGGTTTLRIQPMGRSVSKEENRRLFEMLNAYHRGEIARPSKISDRDSSAIAISTSEK
jgi:hypothetical protein